MLKLITKTSRSTVAYLHHRKLTDYTPFRTTRQLLTVDSTGTLLFLLYYVIDTTEY